MNNALSIIAGEKAYAHLKAQPLQCQDIDTIIAASGGPKWFILYHLDMYLFGEFFADRKRVLNSLGSSAGAWQLACLGTRDPTAALTRLMHHYSNETYSAKPTVDEITDKAQRMVHLLLGASGAKEIVQNPIVKTHILTNRSKHLLQLENRLSLGLGLGATAAANLISRRFLAGFFERVLFHSAGESAFDFADFKTRSYSLRAENVAPVLLATGAIPMIIRGQKQIPGAPAGVYRDGGIMDYHFDLPFAESQGFILYPHFSMRPIPGWFDKQLKWRKVNQKNYQRVIMLVPSQELIQSLPYQKISDRNDFVNLDESTRRAYWQKVIAAGKRMADEFADFVAGANNIPVQRFGAQ